MARNYTNECIDCGGGCSPSPVARVALCWYCKSRRRRTGRTRSRLDAEVATQPDRLARIALYAERAARRQPLFQR